MRLFTLEALGLILSLVEFINTPGCASGICEVVVHDMGCGDQCTALTSAFISRLRS